jgi:hypothetical protein
MILCQSSAPITLVTGGCKSSARWIGRDGKVRCSLHHVQEFGHRDRLIRFEDFEPPENAPPPAPGPLPEKLPGTHTALNELAAQYGIDVSDCSTVAEKQEKILAST